uniref:Uncharacterized LOC114584579 n=1 Tax=Podarcis muralis TaxID=64176 RepID=A0A670JTE5_PODMU|nr:uncharacterized protein LOC114584579 [Podarcis muralis]
MNSSLISPKWKTIILRALWDEKLRNEDRFNETAFVTSWFQKRLRLFISAISADMLQCLHNETMGCKQYQAIVKGLDAQFTKMSSQLQEEVFQSFQLPYLKGLNSNGSSLRCFSANSSFSVFLEEMFQSFASLLTLRDLQTLIPTSDLQKIVNTVSPDALADLFAREGFLNDKPFLTAVLRNYKQNGAFIDKFNQKNVTGIHPNDTKAALLAGVWPTVVSSSNNTEVDMWLSGRLDPYFMFLDGDLLNASETMNTSCVSFRKIVQKLNKNTGMSQDKEEEVYYSIKAYLAAAQVKPRCYNPSDKETSDWLVTYLGNYIRYSNARDMRLLTNNNATIFQDIAFNPDNLVLINRNRLRKDLAEMYAEALFAVDSDFNLESLPDQLICFARRSTQISSLSSDKALNLIAQVNRYCNSSLPSASDRQLATSLVAQVKTFDRQTLVALGQQAMGLTTGQISNLTPQDLVDPQVLESLGQVNGWNRGQSQGLVNKILRSDFTLDTAEKFERLGTLAQGLPSSSFDSISADLAIQLAKNAAFLSALRQGSEHLRKAFVSKILSNSSSLSDILNNVPDDLVDQVPNSLLVIRGKIPDLHKINEKQWSPQQASVLFGDVLSSTDNYTELSAFILQGFQCNVATKLTPAQLSSLVQEVKIKNANLSEEQLSCMAKLLSRNNQAANFTSYPRDVLLFFPLNKVNHQNCEAFYTLASQGNLTLLANGSTQRNKLLENALSCFRVENTSLSKEQLRKLGALVCDMDAATILDSDPTVLENLKLCPDLTAAQRIALNVLLSSGKTSQGAPASWDDGTLEDLGDLALYINRTTWDAINKEERLIFFRKVADLFDSQSASQKAKTILFLKSLGSKSASPPRTRRAPETCRSTPVTTSSLEDPLFIVHYDSAQQFDACLSNEVLKANLVPLLEQPLPNDYLTVIKRKLDEIYPKGIPEDHLKLLGFLSRLYSADEIGRWNITSSDTLAALLSRNNGAWEMAQLRRLVSRYMEEGGSLTGPLLDMLEGKYLCFLDEDQLKQINPEAIRHAEKLDISSCSQGKKDILYEKARTAFASQNGTSAYYPLIQPYLGGAPAEDLKRLAGSQVAMDIATFVNLKPEELQKLSVQDVKGLLGVNLPDLKEVESDPSVALWIKSHFQSELDTLEIGLRGGMTSLSSTATSITVADASESTTPIDTPTADPPTAPSTGSTSFATSDSVTSGDNAAVFSSSSAAMQPLSTPLFETSTAANETSFVSTNITHARVAIDPRVAFSTQVPAISSSVTATSDDTISGTSAPPTARDVNTTTSGRSSADSSDTGTDSTTFPTISIDSTIAASTKIMATSSNVTTASNDTVSGIPDPTSATGINMTANATPASNSTTINDTSLPTTAMENNLTAAINTTPASDTTTINDTSLPTTARETNLTAATNTTPVSNSTTINDTSLPTTAVDTNLTATTNTTPASDTTMINDTSLLTTAMETNLTAATNTTPVSNSTMINDTSLPTTAMETNLTAATNTTPASDTTTINDTGLLTSVTNVTNVISATVSYTPAISTNHTYSANATTVGTSNGTSTTPGMTATTSERPSVLPKPMPNATTPAPISAATKMKETMSTASSKTTVHVPETSPKTGISPQTTRRATSRTPSRTRPPLHPTPNGYINLQPLSGSSSSLTSTCLLLTLSLVVGIPLQRRLL